MALTNARIIELDEISVVNAGSFFVIYDIVAGITYKIKVDNFITTSDQNFNWVSNYEYDEDEVVTDAGRWWQSLQNGNEGHIPTEGAWWTEISKSSGSSLKMWAAGVYTETEVFVVGVVSGVYQIYRLADATRPYVSSNFTTELAAAKWVPLTASSTIATRRATFRFNSDLYTEDEKSFRGLMSSMSEYLTARITSVTYESRLDSSSSWTAHATLSALQTWITANISGNELTGTKFWIRSIATFAGSTNGLAENTLTYTPS
jgi:hypothetical protein